MIYSCRKWRNSMAQKIPHTIKYIQTAQEIEDEIRKRGMTQDSPVYSVREIMKKWKLSSESAQKAVKRLEERGIIYRIPRKGCFVKAPEKKRDNRIFKVAYSILNRSYELKLEQLIQHPEEELILILENSGCSMKNLSNRIFRVPDLIRKQLEGMDGLLVSAVNVNLPECSALYDLKIPTVAIHGDILLDLPIHQVLPDPMPGIRAMFKKSQSFHPDHLIIVSHDHLNGLARAAACRKAAEEFGIHNISSLILGWKDNPYNKAQQLLPSIKNALIFVCSSTIAFSFWEAFSLEKKLRPSADYHLVCYDEIESIGVLPQPVPVMTTIGYSHRDLIRKAAKLLLDEMREPGGCTQKLLIPTHLTIRKSGLSDTDTIQFKS